MDWINLAQDKGKSHAVVKKVLNIRILLMRLNF